MIPVFAGEKVVDSGIILFRLVKVTQVSYFVLRGELAEVAANIIASEGHENKTYKQPIQPRFHSLMLRKVFRPRSAVYYGRSKRQGKVYLLMARIWSAKEDGNSLKNQLVQQHIYDYLT